MINTPDDLPVASELVLLPAENVTVLLKPVRLMMCHSRILSNLPYKKCCFYVSIPRESCTVSHVAKYLAMKFGVEEADEGTVYNFPFAIFEKRGKVEYLPLFKRKTMEELKDTTSCYDPNQKLMTLHYSHDYRVLEPQ